MQTFEENKSEEKIVEKKLSVKNRYHTAPSLNECAHCHRKPGKKFNMDTMVVESVFLYVDARAFKVCNYCKNTPGLLIQKQKMSKKEKKSYRQLQREVNAGINLPHVTLDAKGNEVK